MSSRPGAAPGAGGTGQAAKRGRWEIGTGDAETVLAEARKALFVMVGFLAVIWIIQIVNWADHQNLTLEYGIRPRDVTRLPDILSAPFLHFSWAHIEGNSGPLFIFGFLAAYRGVAKFFGVTALVILTSGLAAWFTEAPNHRGRRQRRRLRLLRLHHGARVLRPAPDRHADRRGHGAVLRISVLRAAAARRDRLAGPCGRSGRRHPVRLDLQGPAARRLGRPPEAKPPKGKRRRPRAPQSCPPQAHERSFTSNSTTWACELGAAVDRVAR